MQTEMLLPIVSFRVGSRTFTTRRETLLRFPDTVLARSLAFGDKDSFWDRDERIFASIFELYRTGRFLPPNDIPYDKINEEMEFWGFQLGTTERLSPLFPLAEEYIIPKGQGTLIPASLGISLRSMDRGCYAVLACVAWSAIGRMQALWEAASVGRRDLTVYWKVQIGSMLCPELLRNHKGFLQELVEKDQCSIEFLPTLSATQIPSQCTPYDVTTSGMLASTKTETKHEWRVRLKTIRRENQYIIMEVDGTQRTSFLYRGFQVSVVASGRKVWWSIHVPNQEEPRAWTLEDTAGFLLEMTVVVDSCFLTMCVFPSCSTRHYELSSSAFLTVCYTLPDKVPARWYHSNIRDQFLETVYVDDGIGDSGPRDVIFLFEDKLEMVLSYTMASAYLPEKHTDRYEALRITW